ncbi:MAG: hypothetical protein KatS3mg029_0915 [Saprospiraceae bacterium]|nr:MAG: hypothetical protein KatS3mg029_0915 [Saprospiraceae bacterium]
MANFFFVLIIALFVALLFLNFYFRLKVFGAYRRLVENRVEFGAAHLFNREKLESEIIPRYPGMERDIRTFCSHIQYSVKIATGLIILITAVGAYLMYFRH